MSFLSKYRVISSVLHNVTDHKLYATVSRVPMKWYYFVTLYNTSNSWQSKLIIFKHPQRCRFLNCDLSISCIFLNTFHYYHSFSTIIWNAQYTTQHGLDFQTVTAVFRALFLIRFMIMIYFHQLYEIHNTQPYHGNM